MINMFLVQNKIEIAIITITIIIAIRRLFWNIKN